MVERYNKLYLLVHPLYDLFIIQGLSESHFSNKVIPKIIAKDKPTIAGLKKAIGIYGDEINKISKDKDALLIIFEPKLAGYERYADRMSHDQFLEFKKEYEGTLASQKELLSRFYKFINTKLGERVIVTNYYPSTVGILKHTSNPDFMTRDFTKKLTKTVDVFAFGEYKDFCVKCVREAIENRLAICGVGSKLHYIDKKIFVHDSKKAPGITKAVKHAVRAANKKTKLQVRENRIRTINNQAIRHPVIR